MKNSVAMQSNPNSVITNTTTTTTTTRSQWHILLNPAALYLQRVLRRLHRHCRLRVLLVHRERLRPTEILIHNHAHPLLTMIANRLTAVKPQRLRVVDHDGENLVCLARYGREVETRENARTVCERGAGRCEGRLHDGMVLGQEVEFQEVAWSCDDVFGLEVQACIGSGGARVDAVDYTCAAWGGCGWVGVGESEEGREGCKSGWEEHDNWLVGRVGDVVESDFGVEIRRSRSQ